MLTQSKLAELKENRDRVTADYLDWTYVGTIVAFDEEYALVKVDNHTQQWIPIQYIETI